MEIPMRGVYPTTNVQLNPTGYNDALVQLNAGANELYPYIPLHFEIPYTVPDWNSKPAVYNMNFVQKWYGNTIQDLKAAGVAYTVVLTFKL
jgi:hypothetical protein